MVEGYLFRHVMQLCQPSSLPSQLKSAQINTIHNMRINKS